MRLGASRLLLLLAIALAGCREEPGRCSSDEGRLCVQVELAGSGEVPDALRVEAESDSPMRTLRQDLTAGVAAAFMARQRFVLEIDLQAVPGAQRVTVQLTALRQGAPVAVGGGTWRRQSPVRPLVVRLVPANEADLRPPAGDLSPPDMAAGWPSGLQALGSLGGTPRRPTDVCWSGARLFVSDTDNNRILVYQSLQPGAMPSYSIGAFADPPTATSLSKPRGLWCDQRFLLVADSANNRVLFYRNPTMASAAATGVVGQANFVGKAANRGMATPQANSLSSPTGVFWDGARLYIADRANNRVVIYNAANETALEGLSGAGAAFVLGQSGFTGAAPGTGEAGLSGPDGVFVAAGRVAVAEVDNNRVTVFDVPSGVMGVTARADAVYGQPNLAQTSSPVSPTASNLSGPSVARALLGFTFVADRLFNRVLIYSGGLLPQGGAGPAAVAVQGQQDFTSLGSGMGPGQLFRPGGLTVIPEAAGDLLVVADEGNNRVQLFRRPK